MMPDLNETISNLGQSINFDCWSSGQMGSKVWLAEKLKENLPKNKWNIWLLAGWYGVLSQILFICNDLQIQKLHSFDIDPNVEFTANKINDYWRWLGKFTCSTKDIQTIKFEKLPAWQEHPNLVINTSLEHLSDNSWWSNLPSETWFAVQSTNLKHKEHINICESIEQLIEQIKPARVVYSGEMFFDYKNENSYTRFMVIGQK